MNQIKSLQVSVIGLAIFCLCLKPHLAFASDEVYSIEEVGEGDSFGRNATGNTTFVLLRSVSDPTQMISLEIAQSGSRIHSQAWMAGKNVRDQLARGLLLSGLPEAAKSEGMNRKILQEDLAKVVLSSPSEGQSNATTGEVTGALRIAFVFVNFDPGRALKHPEFEYSKGSELSSLPNSIWNKIFLTGYPDLSSSSSAMSLPQYYQYEQQRPVTGTIFGTYTLRIDRTAQIARNQCPWNGWYNAALNAAKSDGLKVHDFDRIQVLTPPLNRGNPIVSSVCNFAGFGYDRSSVSWVEIPPTSYDDKPSPTLLQLVVHELGHNDGLHHIGGINCLTGLPNGAGDTKDCAVGDYGAPYEPGSYGFAGQTAISPPLDVSLDPMGSESTLGSRSAIMRSVLASLPDQKGTLGITVTQATESGEYDIYAAELPAGNNPQLLQVMQGKNLLFAVEHREPLGPYVQQAILFDQMPNTPAANMNLTYNSSAVIYLANGAFYQSGFNLKGNDPQFLWVYNPDPSYTSLQQNNSVFQSQTLQGNMAVGKNGDGGFGNLKLGRVFSYRDSHNKNIANLKVISVDQVSHKITVKLDLHPKQDPCVENPPIVQLVQGASTGEQGAIIPGVAEPFTVSIKNQNSSSCAARLYVVNVATGTDLLKVSQNVVSVWVDGGQTGNATVNLAPASNIASATSLGVSAQVIDYEKSSSVLQKATMPLVTKPCAHPLSISIPQSGALNLAPGQSTSFEAAIKNTNPTSCGKSSFNLAPALPVNSKLPPLSPSAISVSSSAVTLAPGAGAHVMVKISLDQTYKSSVGQTFGYSILGTYQDASTSGVQYSGSSTTGAVEVTK